MTGPGYTLSAGPLMLGAFAVATLVGIRYARRGAPRSRIALAIAAVVYGAWVLALTVFPLRFGTLAFDLSADPYWRESMNLVPFRTVLLYLRSGLDTIARVNLLGNLALLVPLGFIAPVLSEKLDGWWRIALLGLSSACAIELLQFARRYVLGMTGRSVDIDDVILNTIGALIGYGLLRLARPLWRRWRRGSTAPAA